VPYAMEVGLTNSWYIVIVSGYAFECFNFAQQFTIVDTLGKSVTEKPVDFVGFDNDVEFNKNRQNDDKEAC